MKAIITDEEIYPVHGLDTDENHLISHPEQVMEIPDELVIRYESVSDKFWTIQEKFDEIVAESWKKRGIIP
jgi:hypothetical protein